MPMNTAIKPMPNIPITISWRTWPLADGSRRRATITNIDGGKDESDEVGRGRPEALARQLVRRQAATEEHDDRRAESVALQRLPVARDARQPRSTSR